MNNWDGTRRVALVHVVHHCLVMVWKYVRACAPAIALALAACTGNINGEDGNAASDVDEKAPDTYDTDNDGQPDVFWAAPAAMRKLSAEQYTQSVRDILGAVEVPTDLEADTSINGFIAVGNTKTTISPVGVEKYEVAAYAIAEQVMASSQLRAPLFSCSPAGAQDPNCAEQTLRSLGRRIFRRPLTDAEVARYANVANLAGNTLGDFYQGFVYALAGLLQSPNFLFRIELGEKSQTQRTYNNYEMASRLSFLLWNTTPDDALLDAAERGELTTDAGLRAQVSRLADDPRAQDALRTFFSELLGLHVDYTKDGAIFPQASATFQNSANEGVLRTVRYLFAEQDAPFQELFTTRETFVNNELANLYGVESPGSGFTRMTLPNDGMRAGLFGQAAYLATHSHATASSPTLRGKFVRQALLCQAIAAPPNDVGELPEASPDLPTMRERLAEHRENPACASCHNLTDPVGLGLENFDGIGAFRETENGANIDATGELDGIAFEDARGVGEAVSQHPALVGCLVRNIYRFATGHIETEGEEVVIARLIDAADDGAFLKALMIEVALSEGFRKTGAGK